MTSHPLGPSANRLAASRHDARHAVTRPLLVAGAFLRRGLPGSRHPHRARCRDARSCVPTRGPAHQPHVSTLADGVIDAYYAYHKALLDNLVRAGLVSVIEGGRSSRSELALDASPWSFATARPAAYRWCSANRQICSTPDPPDRRQDEPLALSSPAGPVPLHWRCRTTSPAWPSGTSRCRPPHSRPCRTRITWRSSELWTGLTGLPGLERFAIQWMTIRINAV